ncbi:MAG: ECF-type sigma factor [Xanthomonadales bacterium]|nr:ECF-type sigma factor [Xanthomonadales bacterium]
MERTADITALLDALADGHGDADQLFAVVYDELRAIAKANRFRWHGDETMNTTALIHEAYLKLAGQQRPDWRSRGHFFATAAKAMRQVLVNYAKRRQTAKRGGDRDKVPLEDGLAIDHDTALELLIVDQALAALEAESPRACRVFECRVFGGLSQDETAEALEISRSTVKRDWTYASARVHQAVDDSPTD